jgi:hypothetical protein
MGEEWEHSRKQFSCEKRKHWLVNYFQFFPPFRGLCHGSDGLWPGPHSGVMGFFF